MASTLTQLTIKNAVVAAKIDGGTALAQYGDHIDNIALNTSATATLFAAVSGNSQQSISDPTETIVINLAQSMKADSFWMFLRTNHGKKGTIEFSPKGGTTPKVVATVTFQAPGVLGGAVGAGTTGATLLVDGMATITPEAAG